MQKAQLSRPKTSSINHILGAPFRPQSGKQRKLEINTAVSTQQEEVKKPMTAHSSLYSNSSVIIRNSSLMRNNK
jgi:hypothetical protein